MDSESLEYLCSQYIQIRSHVQLVIIDFQQRHLHLLDCFPYFIWRKRYFPLSERGFDSSLEKESHETEHQVSSDSALGPMEHGPRLKMRLEEAKGLFNAPESAVVTEHGLPIELFVVRVNPVKTVPLTVIFDLLQIKAPLL